MEVVYLDVNSSKITNNYSARSRLPIITSIPKPAPNIVGHLVPTTGSVGSSVGTWATYVGFAVGDAVTTAHVQSVSDKHCAFLQFPDVAPLAM